MNEKHEKWVILVLIALAIWWLLKKYSTTSATVSASVGGVPVSSQTTTYGSNGSIVSQIDELLMGSQPQNSSAPIAYAPAQPSVVTNPSYPKITYTAPAPVSQMVRSGVYTSSVPSIQRFPVLRTVA